jgi:tetratricopeptide (TPR) repeat protein/tRNA A-37 threonylcarbamoyl transferase component Bud32
MSANTTIGNRYILHERLGSGGMGAVYRATDLLTDSVVALKRVDKPAETLQFSSRSDHQKLHIALANEFQQLASLRHPNIISVLDYGFADQKPFFTMNYIAQARNLTTYAQQAGHRERLHLLVKLLQAISYLHRRGIIHRDLKPENALVGADGQLRVLDFGLAEENPRGAVDGKVVGTLICVAPEVLQGAAPTTASDLYAVGLMAYEMFIGTYPFETQTPSKLVYDIISKEPDWGLLDLEVGLIDLIQRLLSKDPHERPQTAQDVIDAIDAASRYSIEKDESNTRNSFLQAARFIGRDTEIQTLETALEQALKDGRGSAWLIGGESGVGKSRLQNEIRIRAMVKGATVLSGQGVTGGGLPFQLWRDPIRNLALAVAIDDLDASILKEIAPDLDRLLGRTIPPAPQVDRETAQKRLINAIVALFRQHQRPTVILLEDLQWMDESLTVLNQVSQITADLPLLVIGSYRSDERADLPDHLPHMQHMHLDRLSTEEISHLSQSMLGDSGTEEHVVDLLHKETEGNVFFIVETVRALAEEAGSLNNVGRMTLPPTVFAGGVQMVIERRLGRLPAIYRPLLNLAAIAGRQIDLTLMHALADTVDVDEWLTACANIAVFTVQDGVWRFAHDKLREGTLMTLSAEEHAALNAQVATVIETIYPDDAAFYRVLADHWHAAGNTDKEARYAYLTGRQLYETQLQTARDYLQRARSLIAADDARYPHVLWMLATIFTHTTNYTQAEEFFITARDLAQARGQADHTVRALLGLSKLYVRRTTYERAAQIAREALAHAQDLGDEALIANAYNRIAGVLLEEGNFAAAKQYLMNSLEIALTLDDQTVIALTYNNLGMIAYRTGESDIAWNYFEKALAIRRDAGIRHAIAAGLNNLGVIAGMRGHYDDALSYHQESYQIKRAIGDRFGMSNSLTNLGIAAMNAGEYPRAEQYFRQALEICYEVDNRLGIADNLNNIGLILRRQNQNLHEARDLLERAIVTAQEVGDRLGYALALTNLADVLIELGNYQAALDRICDALQETRTNQAMQPMLRAIMWYGKLQAQWGDTLDAVRLCSFVNLHPSVDGETQQDSEQMLTHFSIQLSAEQLVSAVEASKTLELEALVDTIITRYERGA